MIPISLDILSKITNGYLYGENLIITDVSTNTNNIPNGSLFIALIGQRFDAHMFAKEAVLQGAHALLVQHLLPIKISQVIVNDTRIALGQLSSWVRQQTKVRMIALTGSSGKTSVKEMTAAILSQCGNTLHTIKNLNNSLGVCMTLLCLTTQHDYAVIELGANHHGEIAYGTELIQPETALINNLAPAHLKGFGSLNGLAKAKGEIFNALSIEGTAIINNESNDLSNWSKYFLNKRLWRFSLEYTNNAEFYASNICINTKFTLFTLHTPRGDVKIKLFLLGRHNIANALAAAALSMSVDAPLNAISTGLQSLRSIPGRLCPIYLSTNQLILDDSYNANVGSMIAAINFLKNISGFRVLVVGDMAELGDQTEAYHRQIGKVVKASGIDCILSIGTFSYLISKYCRQGKHFIYQSSLIEHLEQMLSKYKNITILIKGSHNANLRQIVQSLQEKKHATMAS
ncbi:UDP-N-acetylmuramoyl-tripeptide--D-alanyl-D-alanine ligase [Pantoea sp. Mhis]|uniref:UDP-N-acetylmuramoyl-tripeptide--D-alanyl-D- alanine ligase n=1 Tax=Pantoea sp. Mhis TaxID=2576759 RepID=UPI00135C27F7|nr:UDP-N-acetylmuramoyl-tripeptide--D-alanyl-D-alanine ligase [Pantoea sp. Mhis]MXP56491.1 UDP-N-acetylmuramoyl-tripeptide--D-alanyl-D-alanine ligase [Pantoea sp. Mhis]